MYTFNATFVHCVGLNLYTELINVIRGFRPDQKIITWLLGFVSRMLLYILFLFPIDKKIHTPAYMYVQYSVAGYHGSLFYIYMPSLPRKELLTPIDARSSDLSF